MKYISSIKKNYVENINDILETDPIDIQCGTKWAKIDTKSAVQTALKGTITSHNFIHELFSTKTIDQKCRKKSIPFFV